MAKDGVQFEPSPAFKHSLNGVIKRAIGIITEIARTIMYQAKMPYQLWDYLVEHAVWIKNRLPTAALPFGNKDHFVSILVTPYAAYIGTLLDFKDLYTFG